MNACEYFVNDQLQVSPLDLQEAQGSISYILFSSTSELPLTLYSRYAFVWIIKQLLTNIKAIPLLR